MPSETQSYRALINTQAALDELATRLASDQGPVAIDAERASGYRYYQKAYLLQVNHQQHGTWLIDPINIQIDSLNQALQKREWVIHAATQDLPCLRELGMRPDQIFDTELAGRLLGMPRVALAVMLDEFVGVKLAKQHSAADWSKRPLPATWLEYAALDVAYLFTLKERVTEALAQANKLDWAQQEFASLLDFEPATKKDEPWRRLSGVHLIGNDRARAIARSLWFAREEIAEQTDTAPGRVLSDSAILAAANALPGNRGALAELREFQSKNAQVRFAQWWDAVERAMAEPVSELPPRQPPKKPMPRRSPKARAGEKPMRLAQPPKINAKTDPAAAERLGAARVTLREIGERVNIPPENLLPAAALRAAVWLPPAALDPIRLAETLRQNGARQWQVELTSGALLEALVNPKLLTSKVMATNESQPETERHELGPE